MRAALLNAWLHRDCTARAQYETTMRAREIRFNAEKAKRIVELESEVRALHRRRLYGCARRGCDAVNPDYLSFGAGKLGYCLHHIPRRYRLKLWWQERTQP